MLLGFAVQMSLQALLSLLTLGAFLAQMPEHGLPLLLLLLSEERVRDQPCPGKSIFNVTCLCWRGESEVIHLFGIVIHTVCSIPVCLLFTQLPPHRQSLPAQDSNPQPFDYESDSLALGHNFPHIYIYAIMYCYYY